MAKEYETRGASGFESIVRETANVLLVGDQINFFADQPGAAFGWGTVTSVTEHEVECIRPFVHTSDFSVSAGAYAVGTRLLSYLGQEVIKLPRDGTRVYTVVFRSTVPK